MGKQWRTARTTNLNVRQFKDPQQFQFKMQNMKCAVGIVLASAVSSAGLRVQEDQQAIRNLESMHI